MKNAKLMSSRYFMFLPPSLLQEMPHYVTGRMAYVCILTILVHQQVPIVRRRITAHFLHTNVAAGKNFAEN